jgi:hypothetical protein
MPSSLVSCINLQLHMRGYQSLFKGLFDDLDGNPGALPCVATKRKGRDPEWHRLRTEGLVARYYYYVRFNREWRYEYIIETLSKEFYLSTITIPELIQNNDRQLQVLKNEKPDKSWFKKKWPHLVW